MKIMIDIPKEDFERCKKRFQMRIKIMGDAIANGTPLPKGHGRLIDADKLYPDSDYEDGIFYAVSIGQIDGAEAIVEAESEVTE